MPNGESPGTTVIQIPFAGGIDEKTATEYLDPSQRQVNITNGNFTKIGALDHRLGLKKLPNTTIGGPLAAITQASRGASWSRSSQVIAGQQGLYTYAQAQQGTVGVGPLPGVRPVRRPIATTSSFVYPTVGDYPYNGRTLRIVVYPSGNFGIGAGIESMIGQVQDADTGDIVLPPTIIYTGTFQGLMLCTQIMYLKDAPVGQQAIIVITDGGANGQSGTNNIFALYYNPVTNKFTSPTGLGIDAALVGGIPSRTSSVDAVPWFGIGSNLTQNFVVIHNPLSNAISISVYKYDFTVVFAETFDIAPAGAGYAGANFVWASRGTGEYIWVIYGWATAITSTYQYFLAIFAGDGSFTLVYPPILIASKSTAQTFAGIIRINQTQAYLNYYDPSTNNTGQFLIYDALLNAEVDNDPMPQFYLPICRPFLVNGVVNQLYILYMSGSSEQYSLYCMATYLPGLTQNRILPTAVVAPRITQIIEQYTILQLTGGSHLPLMSGTNADGTALRGAFGFKINPQNILDAPPSWALDLYWDPASLATLYQDNELASELHISSGVPMVFDGIMVVEDNFFHYPEVFSLATNITGTLSGTYGYAVVYARTDAAGLVHRGVPVFESILVLVQGVTITIPTYNVGYSDLYTPGSVVAEIYRTVQNGAIFYLMSIIQVSNQPTAFVSITDNHADNAISSNMQLYNTPVGQGAFDNINPAAALFALIHNDRVVQVDESLRETWESQQFDGTSAPGFNEILITLYPDSGDITALAGLDANLVVFKASSIWLRTGTGPPPSGVGGDWSLPQQLPTPVGCKDWRSVVLMPDGLMFQAPDNNIYMLSRGLQVTYIGKNVTDTMQAFPTVVAATMVPLDQQVRFLCTNGTTSICVVYDYFVQQWTTHVYAQLSAPVAAAYLTFNSPQQYTIVTTDGNIWQEHLPTDTNAYMDDDSSGTPHFVPLSATIPWVRLHGVPDPQDNQRARQLQFLGEQLDDCGMQLTYAINYDPTIVQTYKWSAKELQELTNPGQVQAFVAAQHNRQQAIQITLSDVAGTSMVSGQGMRFVNLAIELMSCGIRWGQLSAGARR